MEIPALYRKRLIPDECIELKDDILLYRNQEILVTKWLTIRPKKTLHHGYSCYFMDKGVKISKFFNADNDFLCWYCDIITYTYNPVTDTYIFTDLLADVIILPNGQVKVVDLDELADAFSRKLITSEMLLSALQQLDWLLNEIYNGRFADYKKIIEQLEEE